MTAAEDGDAPAQALVALPEAARAEAARPEAARRPAWRIRRRRALASALRRVALREMLDLPPEPLRARLLAIAASQGVFLPSGPEADLSELVARIEPGTTLPVELVPVLAALLQPLFGPPAALPLGLMPLGALPETITTAEPRSPAR
ncbi:hypothetical protein BKE38_22040 [Pseudoroseomonas deserti]|uniref:Uncharacterized protein n=1 Tax=Teichococcus deserti TaxID=1817963 RepID=A0A1V2GXI8_9PROT|nr:hypothetical protein [Pseudoroseomonas deserti]ONG48351.1 hypothetical protein BKE38_22040 [Pseudoroseomonas deserti]